MATLSVDQQHEAAQLYLSGKSARQVSEYFNVGIGSVYYALRRQSIPRRTSQESNTLIYKAKPLSFKVKEKLTAEEEKLKIAACMLYWAEGYKVGKTTIDFANSDPAMASIFIKFLRKICNVTEERIRCSLYCYEGQDISSLTSFWSHLLEVHESQFTKPYIKQKDPGVRGARMIHGLVHIRYCDKKLL